MALLHFVLVFGRGDFRFDAYVIFAAIQCNSPFKGTIRILKLIFLRFTRQFLESDFPVSKFAVLWSCR